VFNAVNRAVVERGDSMDVSGGGACVREAGQCGNDNSDHREASEVHRVIVTR
jgi:hypothetical protein